MYKARPGEGTDTAAPSGEAPRSSKLLTRRSLLRSGFATLAAVPWARPLAASSLSTHRNRREAVTQDDEIVLGVSAAFSNEIKLWANMGYLFNDNMQFYAHGNYVSKQVEGGFYFRNPGTRSGVFGTVNADGQRILLIGDMLDAHDGVLDGSAGCPEVPVTDDGVVTDQAALTQVLNNPDCFTFRELFPGGFTPQFGSYVLDASVVTGLKGSSGDLDWDASASWGKSNLDFYMYNTVNASLGPNQPCTDDSRTLSFVVPNQPCTPWFNPGINDQQEINFNFDLSYALNERVNIAGGAEWRNERFEIIQGSTESWTQGPLATAELLQHLDDL